jgi:hypothetical protein
MGFSVKKAFKSVGKIVSAPFVEPVKAVQKVAEGDYYGAANSVVKTASLGTLGLPSVNTGIGNGGEDATGAAEQQLVDAREDSKKRRRALYATKGGASGEEVESVGDTFGNGRGTLFGN